MLDFKEQGGFRPSSLPVTRPQSSLVQEIPRSVYIHPVNYTAGVMNGIVLSVLAGNSDQNLMGLSLK